MFSGKMMITNSGKAVLLRALGGEAFTFTKFAIGDGSLTGSEDPEAATVLKHVVLDDISITETADTLDDGYIQLTGVFDSTDLSGDFLWKELGLFVEDEDNHEYLYAYSYEPENYEYIQSSTDPITMEQKFAVVVAVGTTQNISVNVLPTDEYASREDFEAHIRNYNNPHQVDYSKALPQPDGAAPASHTHNMTDIDGILPIECGGIGTDDIDEFASWLDVDAGFVFGFYIGDGTRRKDIYLGFSPIEVRLFPMLYGNEALWKESAQFEAIVYDYYSKRDPSASNSTNWSADVERQVPNGSGMVFGPDNNLYYGSLHDTSGINMSADQLEARGTGGAAVTSDGFMVSYGTASNVNRTDTNENGRVYLYMAAKRPVT